MVNKITTMPRSKAGERIGRLTEGKMVRLGRAIVVFFGPAGNSPAGGDPRRRGHAGWFALPFWMNHAPPRPRFPGNGACRGIGGGTMGTMGL